MMRFGTSSSIHPNRMKNKHYLALLIAMAWSCGALAKPSVTPVAFLPDAAHVTATYTVTRVEREPGSKGSLRYQWPGAYFETAFKGTSAFFAVGKGDVILRLLVDGDQVETLTKPAVGYYEVQGLSKSEHRLRVEAITESQAGANEFGGFYLPKLEKPIQIKPRARQIEFIGDSHTVGYGNTSGDRECTEEQVWERTDNSQAFGPITAKHFDADYEINAISGLGIVRNYNGGPNDTMPVAYPFVLFDHAQRATNPSWKPQWIVISLGTNDFSTELHDGEKWKSREELHADFEETFVQFVHDLRKNNPHSHLLFWATNSLNKEIPDEVAKVVSQLRATGENDIGFIPIPDLAMDGCHYHPSIKDHQKIAKALMDFIEARAGGWKD